MEFVCVYCGSNPGRDPAYVEAAEAFGRALAARDLGLVYGGGNVGLMGAVANAALDAGGEVYGVIPDALADRELAHRGVTQLEVVGSMHGRKRRMADLADGFVALPGGFGTLEELLEMLTWAQLGFHRDPCGLLDVEDYYGKLVAFFDEQAREGFVREDHRGMLVVSDDPDDLLDRFAAYDPPAIKAPMEDGEQ